MTTEHYPHPSGSTQPREINALSLGMGLYRVRSVAPIRDGSSMVELPAMDSDLQWRFQRARPKREVAWYRDD
ncbi:MAG TPA: hypothetical protein VL551_33960, partial [Actinospica sp.]|nr:hypothetical protein [Actinospica sp.]